MEEAENICYYYCFKFGSIMVVLKYLCCKGHVVNARKNSLCYGPCGNSFQKSRSVPTLFIWMSKLYTICYHSNFNNQGALLSFTWIYYNYLKSIYVCLLPRYKRCEGEGSNKRTSISGYFLPESLKIKSLKT